MTEPASSASASGEPAQDETPAAITGEPPEQPAEPVQVRLRRAPRYRAFVVAGAVLGALAGLVAWSLLGDPDSRFSARATAGYLAAIGLLLGGLLGAAVAVLVERPRR